MVAVAIGTRRWNDDWQWRVRIGQVRAAAVSCCWPAATAVAVPMTRHAARTTLLLLLPDCDVTKERVIDKISGQFFDSV